MVGRSLVRRRARIFTDKARQLISEFHESPYQSALCAITDLVTDREY